MRKAPLWRFSHVGLFVKDLDRMAQYYKQVFSMVETDGGEARGHNVKFLSRDPTEHHQLVLETSRTSEETTLQQLSFRFSTLDDLRQMKARIEALPRNLLSEEMVPYGVNHGIAWSLYSHDPEGNRIEIFIDSPFYVCQPCVNSLDLSKTDDEILQETKDKFEDDLTFKPRREWSKELEDRL